MTTTNTYAHAPTYAQLPVPRGDGSKANGYCKEKTEPFSLPSVVAVNEKRDDRARLREATDQLRACGIETPEKIMRLAAAAMVTRCVERFGDRPALLVRVLLDGGVIFDDERPARRESPSDILRALQP